MRDLETHGVTVVALSKDTVEEAAVHKTRDKLTLTLLSDSKLEVIKQYGVEHHKALGLATTRFSLFGIPFSFVPSYKTMAIPTSLLVSEEGVIVWIDQSEDHRLRSNEERVLQAIEGAFARA